MALDAVIAEAQSKTPVPLHSIRPLCRERPRRDADGRLHVSAGDTLYLE